MIIDVHNHPDWHGHNVDKFIENMDACGIDKTWLLSWESPMGDYNIADVRATTPINPGPWGPIGFDRCVAYAEKAPDRFILGYAPDPRRPDAIDRMKAAVAIHGVKVYGEMKLRMMLDNWDAIRMYRYCGENGIPVLVHIDYEFDYGTNYPRPNYWFGGGIEAFERAIKACPETTFIGHAPGFWAHISGDDQYKVTYYPEGKVLPGGKLPEMLEKYPNLYCDISAGSGCGALKRDPEFTKKFLCDYSDRILYGRDEFSNEHQEFLNTLDLPQDVQDKIYYKNACKLVPIE